MTGFAGFVTQAAQRATPEQRERIRRLRRASDTSPSPEREAARAEIALAVHGIVVEHWRCLCGAEYAYPHSHCLSCRRHLPRKCIASGCGNVTEPDGDTRPPDWCSACATDFGRRARALSYARSSIPPRERAAAQRIVTYTHQAAALKALDEWVGQGQDSRTWRRVRHDIDPHVGGTCAVYLGGHPGSGKSVLAAHAVYRAYVDLGLVDGFRWHSQASLAQLFSERFARDNERSRERADAAIAEWRAVTETQLLVIDDLFASTPTPGFGEALASLIRERLDHVRPTILTANVRPQWAVYFEGDVGRLESRWRGYGLELSVAGADLRRAA